MTTDEGGLDDASVAVLAHVVLQHLSVVSAAIALLADDDPGRARPPAERLLEQARTHTASAVELLRDLVRGVPPETGALGLPPPPDAS